MARLISLAIRIRVSIPLLPAKKVDRGPRGHLSDGGKVGGIATGVDIAFRGLPDIMSASEGGGGSWKVDVVREVA